MTQERGNPIGFSWLNVWLVGSDVDVIIVHLRVTCYALYFIALRCFLNGIKEVDLSTGIGVTAQFKSVSSY